MEKSGLMCIYDFKTPLKGEREDKKKQREKGKEKKKAKEWEKNKREGILERKERNGEETRSWKWFRRSRFFRYILDRKISSVGQS